MSGNGYVDSPLINNYPTIHAETRQYNDVKMKADEQEGDRENGIIICNNQTQLNTALRNKVNADYNAGADKPTVTIKADMVLLQDVIGYEEYANLMEVSLGDTVHCYHNKLGIITDARVDELTYDCITEKVIDVTLSTGGIAYNYFNNVSNIVGEAQKAFSSGTNGTFIIGDKTITVNKGVITEIA